MTYQRINMLTKRMTIEGHASCGYVTKISVLQESTDAITIHPLLHSLLLRLPHSISLSHRTD